MGLKGAPSYFQKEMATLVLGGLIHIILELYIDDILIHGKTEEEFLELLYSLKRHYFMQREVLTEKFL
jgi:hypothetical protein